jgi:hypothetical protein
MNSEIIRTVACNIYDDFYLFLKHNSRLDLTNRWHPQVKLNGREPAQLSSPKGDVFEF